MDLALIPALLSLVLILVNIAGLTLSSRSLHRRFELPLPERTPPVSIVVPSRGIEPFTAETLERAFALDWPSYELLFCVAQSDDPAAGTIRAAMARHAHVPARLLVGDDRVSANPKLNNCVKGWEAARHEWVILADSNVLMPRDYIGQMMAAWRHDTGVVSSTPVGSRPDGFWAEVECAFLNTLQARWQYTGAAVGFAFAQGKSMLWNKPMLEALGGIRALGAEIAEDAAATKLVRRAGLKVRLVASPFEQPLGRRGRDEVWSRQVRWARLRRVTFPAFFAPEILLGAMPPLFFALLAAAMDDASLAATAFAVLAATYLPECLLAFRKGWYLKPRLVAAMLVRDVLLPAIWLRGWIGAAIEWRGNAMQVVTRREAETLEQAA